MNKTEKVLIGAGIGIEAFILISALIMLAMGYYFTPFFL